MKIKQTTIMTITTIITVISMNFLVLINSVKATGIQELPQINLKYTGTCEKLLTYKGIPVKVSYVEYEYNGKYYPAYCLNKSLDGVDENREYAVTPNTKIDDLGLWRTIINGYPYKSLSELGVVDEQEAFTATKQAIYCYLFENTLDDYDSTEESGEAGIRTLNALKQIVANAESSSETQAQTSAEIKPESENWEDDEINANYVSKVYSITSSIKHLDYEVEISENIPKGTKIINLEGEETTKFSSNQKFKIMLPKDKLEKDGDFIIHIKTELKTKPVLYGASPNSSWQNYALTVYMYEDADATLVDTYKKIDETKTSTAKEKVKILPITGM